MSRNFISAAVKDLIEAMRDESKKVTYTMPSRAAWLRSHHAADSQKNLLRGLPDAKGAEAAPGQSSKAPLLRRVQSAAAAPQQAPTPRSTSRLVLLRNPPPPLLVQAFLAAYPLCCHA